MTDHVDFSSNASVYDARHGAFIDADLAGSIARAAEIDAGARVLEVGAGTGRAAIPLASAGCRFVAIDTAIPMLQRLREKAQSCDAPVSPLVGNGLALPFADDVFEACVVSRILYLIQEWPAFLTELLRVLRPGGCVIHEWGNGDEDEPWVLMREEARRLFIDAGVTRPFHPGARYEAEIEAFLEEHGLIQQQALTAGFGKATTIGEFLQRILNGEASYIWNVPEEVRRECLPKLEAWTKARFDLGQEIIVPRTIRWRVYRKG